MTKEYSEEDIKTLEPYEHIRIRREMYIGDRKSFGMKLVEDLRCFGRIEEFEISETKNWIKSPDLIQPAYKKPGPSGRARFELIEMFQNIPIGGPEVPLMGYGAIINTLSNYCSISVRDGDYTIDVHFNGPERTPDIFRREADQYGFELSWEWDEQYWQA